MSSFIAEKLDNDTYCVLSQYNKRRSQLPVARHLILSLSLLSITVLVMCSDCRGQVCDHGPDCTVLHNEYDLRLLFSRHHCDNNIMSYWHNGHMLDTRGIMIPR